MLELNAKVDTDYILFILRKNVNLTEF